MPRLPFTHSLSTGPLQPTAWIFQYQALLPSKLKSGFRPFLHGTNLHLISQRPSPSVAKSRSCRFSYVTFRDGSCKHQLVVGPIGEPEPEPDAMSENPHKLAHTYLRSYLALVLFSKSITSHGFRSRKEYRWQRPRNIRMLTRKFPAEDGR